MSFARDYEVTDELRFTRGDCHFLARALHLRTGWPMMAFVYWDDPELHAFVRMPDGRALDVMGAATMLAFKRRWKRKRVAEFDWATLRRVFDPKPAFGHYTYERARVVADRLVAEHA